MLRIGSIGAGGRGGIVRMTHRPDEGSQLAMVCDTRPKVREAYREQFGDELAITDDWREVVAREDLDAIFVTTPDFLHEEHAVAALEAGKAVYLEKPIGITIEQCDAILDAARRNGNRLYVGHNMRFFPAMQRIKQLIDSGTIGEVQCIWVRHFIDYGGDAYFKDWHSEQRFTTGLLLQKAAHDIDLIHWFGGGYTSQTVGMGKLSVYDRVADRRPADQPGDATFNEDNWPPLSQTQLSPTIDVEDSSMMLMQLDNGVQASYMQCHYTPDGYRNYTIIGTEGRIENVGDHTGEGHAAQIYVWRKRCGAKLDQHETITIPLATGSHGGADPAIVHDFLQFVATGKAEGARPLDARMSVAAGVMATESLRDGSRPRSIPSLPQEVSAG